MSWVIGIVAASATAMTVLCARSYDVDAARASTVMIKKMSVLKELMPAIIRSHRYCDCLVTDKLPRLFGDMYVRDLPLAGLVSNEHVCFLQVSHLHGVAVATAAVVCDDGYVAHQAYLWMELLKEIDLRAAARDAIFEFGSVRPDSLHAIGISGNEDNDLFIHVVKVVVGIILLERVVPG